MKDPMNAAGAGAGSARRVQPVTRFPRYAALLCLALLCLPGAAAQAAEKTAFWLALRSNMILDRQVADEIGPRGGMFVLRAPREGPAAAYSFQEIAARLKSKAQGSPVLSYALVSRSREQGRIEVYLLQGLDLGRPLAQGGKGGERYVNFLDVTDPKMRRVIVDRLAAERQRLGVDGFAIDLATRTPSARPKALANLCGSKPAFCEAYARSMDDMMGTLNAALGTNGTLLYNGIWNFAPGTIEDQSRLLLQADAAAIEYFGLDPSDHYKGFKTDVLPYLEAIPRLQKGKPALFFGRGPWAYADYAADYRWQRYLYGAFLLARRAEDMFKYHSSFQIPTSAGRSGGLDVYSDWNIDLGAPAGAYRVEGGLYQREFARGRVVVAPDDGAGGKVRLASTYYNPDGQPVSGEVALAAGEALILLTAREQVHAGPATRQIDARRMASWGWAQAELATTAGGERLRLAPLPAGMEGEHDVLLDYERSLVPFERLEINATLSPGSSVLAVAEVDDPRGEHMRVVVAIDPSQAATAAGQVREAVQFRARQHEREKWPRLRFEHNPAANQAIVLDGPRVFAATDYRFRRWSHARLAGPLEISDIRLSQRSPVLASSKSTPSSAAAPAKKAAEPRQKAESSLEARFRAADTNRDNGLSQDELAPVKGFASIRRNFGAMDVDRDNKVTLEEYRAWARANRALAK